MSNDVEDRLRDLLAHDASRAPASDDLAGQARGLVRRRRQRHAAWCGAAALVVVLGGVALVGSSQTQSERPRADGGTASPGPDATESAAPGSPRRGAVSLPVSGQAACAVYTPENVFAQADGFDVVAFDGTVTAVQAPARRGEFATLSFSVGTWFEGGSGASTTVRFPTGFSIDQGPPPYEVGTRLLVSGSRTRPDATAGPVSASGCGFTRYYDESTARAWQQAAN